jgi:putative phosphoribosyl transferase
MPCNSHATETARSWRVSHAGKGQSLEMIFRDRFEAGRALAERLGRYAGRSDLLVLALPRGGVPVGYELARALDAPLDVFIVRKLGVPGHEELALGAIATGGMRVLNEDVVEGLRIDRMTIERVAEQETRELARREELYREGRSRAEIEQRIVILVDDGLATGSSMRVAARAVRDQRPARLVIAVPVGSADTCDSLRSDADEVVCLSTPSPFRAVGLWYEDFSETRDAEVRDLLAHAAVHGKGTR